MVGDYYRALSDCTCSVLSRSAEHCGSIGRSSTPWSRSRLLTLLIKLGSGSLLLLAIIKTNKGIGDSKTAVQNCTDDIIVSTTQIYSNL